MRSQPLTRAWPLALLVLLCAPLVWVVLIADGWTVNRLVVRIVSSLGPGFPLGPDDVDLILNTAMLAPFAFLAGVGFPRTPWWLWWLAGFLTSLSIETTQFFMGTRDASWVDLLLNTVGAGVGAALALLVNRRLARRVQGPDGD